VKKTINNPLHAVREMLEGFVDMNPNQTLFEHENIVIQTRLIEKKTDNVAIVSGGGSGHEPAQSGYVGEGLLHAAVAGGVFASPSSDAILQAIRTSTGTKGVLLIVANYTGDRLNFGWAAEQARSEGIPVEIVIVADDVSMHETVEKKHRRGIAGVVFTNKIAGAVSAAGADLQTVKKVVQDAVDHIASMGVAFGSCTLPGLNKPIFELPEGEMELGLGVHGEKGVLRTLQQPADEVVDRLLEPILHVLNIKAHDKVALLVNGLGSTTHMELAIITRHALQHLREQNIFVQRAWSGNFITSLDMPGFSISLMRLNDLRLDYLDRPTNAPAWRGDGKIPITRSIYIAPKEAPIQPASGSRLEPKLYLRDMALRVADALEKEEHLLTELDCAAGDGDLGLSILRGVAAIRALPASAWENEKQCLKALSETLQKNIGGSSGPLLGVALLSASNHLDTQLTPTPEILAEAFIIAARAVSQLGGAHVGDRSMVDALYPAAHAFQTAIKQEQSLRMALKSAVAAAEFGTKKTASMLPKVGRACYLGERALGTEDGGASTPFH